VRKDDIIDLGIDLGEPDFTTKNDRPGFISSSGWPVRREITKLNDNMKIMVKQMSKLKKQISKLEKKLNG
tara:strand:+ start:10804 stop:11013 length:210 start_codon:yes stop_codon:yes gene_type:complete